MSATGIDPDVAGLQHMQIVMDDLMQHDPVLEFVEILWYQYRKSGSKSIDYIVWPFVIAHVVWIEE